jgi:hypothetical protein
LRQRNGPFWIKINRGLRPNMHPSPLMRPGFHAFRWPWQGTRAAAERAAGQHGAQHGWRAPREHDPLRVQPRTLLWPALQADRSRTRRHAGEARPSVCVPRMIIIRSSYDPTSATAGHAATAARTMPWPKPWATFAASVATIPKPRSQRASVGTCAPRRRIQNHHRTRVDQPVHRQGYEAPGPAGLAVRPPQRTRVLVRHNSRDRSDAEHRQRR